MTDREIKRRLAIIAERAHLEGVDPSDAGPDGPMAHWIARNVTHSTDGFALTFILCCRVASLGSKLARNRHNGQA